MKGVNKVILIGTCGADPEIKSLPNGTAVATVSLATTESFKDKSGEKRDETQWHRLTFFGVIVDNLVKPYIKKGSQIFVEGKLRHNKYEKDGKTSYFTDILVREITLLGSAKRDGAPSSYNSEQATGSASEEPIDDDIPF